jgi:hypothetical protein
LKHILDHTNGNVTESAKQTFAGYAQQLPFASEGLDVSKALNEKNGGITYLHEMTKNLVDPAGAQYIQRLTDKYKREPDKHNFIKGELQSIESGIPGLSKNVPAYRPDNRTEAEKALGYAPLK